MASKKILEKNPASGPKSFTGPRARAQDEVPESGPRPTVDDMSDSEISIPKATKAELEIIQRQLEDFQAQHQRSGPDRDRLRRRPGLGRLRGQDGAGLHHPPRLHAVRVVAGRGRRAGPYRADAGSLSTPSIQLTSASSMSPRTSSSVRPLRAGT